MACTVYEKSRVNGPIILSKSSTSRRPVPIVPATLLALFFSWVARHMASRVYMRRYSVTTASASGDIRVFCDSNVSWRIRPMSFVGYDVGAESSSSVVSSRPDMVSIMAKRDEATIKIFGHHDFQSRLDMLKSFFTEMRMKIELLYCN